MVKLKFVVSEKTTRLHWDKSKGTLGTCKLLPVSGGSNENKAFYEATPSGSVEFGTINQAALDSLPLGAEVFITIEVARVMTQRVYLKGELSVSRRKAMLAEYLDQGLVCTDYVPRGQNGNDVAYFREGTTEEISECRGRLQKESEAK